MGIYIIGVVVLLLSGGMWALGVKAQTPKRTAKSQTPDRAYQEVAFMSKNATLKGWFIPAQNQKEQQSPLIILVHGWSSGKSRVLRYVEPLHKEGYSLLMFDARGHGESDAIKAPTVKSFREDVKVAVQYAKSRGDINPDRIGILGHSFGAMGSLLANKHEIGIKALVTDSMPARFRTILEALLSHYKLPYYPLGPILTKIMFFRAGITSKEMRDFDIPLALNQRKAPVLLIHSSQDSYVPSKELDYLIQSQDEDREKVEYLYVESKGHRSSEKDPKFWKHVLPFLKKHV